jgi:magnesium transporter
VIRAVRYESGSAAPDDVDQDRLLDAIDPDTGLLWVDVGTPTEAEFQSLARQLDLSSFVVEDLHHGGQRTKLERYHDHFHVAVHDCSLAGRTLVTREVDIVFGDGWLLSVRQQSDDPTEPQPFDVDATTRRFEAGRGEGDVVDEGLLVWAFLDVIVDRFFDLTDVFDDRLDDAEERVFGGDGGNEISKEIFDLRRAMVSFRRSVAPLREVLNELLRKEASCITDDALVRLRDVEDHVLRAADLIETQRDLLAGLLESNLAVASNRMNDVMKKLTAWGAILLGSTLIAGIYGMNFDEMPELRWAFGYPAAIGSMLLLTIVLYVYFKRRKYL